MPQDCPRCSRPNGDAATRCLYCGATLEPRPPEEPAESSAAAWPDTFTVLVTGSVRDSQLAAFEEIAGRPAAWLDAGLPLPIRTEPDLEGAMALHGQLAEAGISSTVVADQRLGESGVLLVARRATRSGAKLVFSAADERRAEIAPADLRIFVRATIVDTSAVDDGKLRGRAMTGRVFPQMAGGAERIHVLDLHPASSCPVRIVAERFDYSILGAERGPLAVDNFERLVEILTEGAPRAATNTAFSKVVVDDARTPQSLQLELHGRRLLQALLQSE